MKRQSLLKVFMALGVILSITGAAYSYMVLAPKVSNLPDDFHYTADIDSVDNLFDEERNQFSGAQVSRTNFSYSTVSSDENTLLIDNSLEVKTLSGKPIIDVTKRYAIDKTTYEHVKHNDIKTRSGFLFAPKGIESGQSYKYWHVNYDEEIEMEFISEESLLGVKVYKYKSTFKADQTDILDNLDGVPEKYRVVLDVELTTWIEPKTGRLVNLVDSASANFVDKSTGTLVKPWNRFTNNFNQPSVEEQITTAKAEIENLRFYEFILPISLVFLAALLFTFMWVSLSTISTKLPVIVFVTGILITLLTFQGVNRGIEFNKTAEFDRKTAELEDAIKTRLKFYDDTLHAAQGFIEASNNVTKEEWNIFSSSINLPNRLPGILGIGYSLKIDKDQSISEFEDKYKAILGNPDFNVRPVIPDSENHAIVFLDPLTEQNKQAIGYNMYSQETRARGMQLAASTGTTTISGAVTLVQEIDETDIQKGFLMYLPQYEASSPTTNESERLEALTGFVYSPFRAGDLIQSVINETGDDINFEIYSESTSEDNLIFRHVDDTSEPLIKNTELNIFQSKWLIRYFASPETYSGIYTGGATTALLSGIALTILSTGIAALLTSLGSRASKLAKSRTIELSKSEESAKKLAHEAVLTNKSLEKSKSELQRQNQMLQENKKTMFNILEDLDSERKKLSETIAQDEALLKGIGDGLVATDIEGKIILTNPAFEKIIGLSQKEVLGKKISDVVKLHNSEGEVSSDSKDIYENILFNKESKEVTNFSDKYIKSITGNLTPVSVSLSPIRRGGETIGMVEVFRDITHEKQIDRAKSEFVSLASHQLRTPLTAINWYSDMLTAGDAGKLNEEQTKYVQEVRAGSQRMVDLVNALLNVSRVDLGTFMIEPEMTDVIELCKKIVQDSEPKIFERKQNFKENYAKDIPQVNIDGQLMRMVIENLVSNAIKYTPEKGDIDLSIEKDDKHLTIAVKDTGYGIPKAQQDKIFSKMFRADNVVAHDTEGTGLGLYLAKSVIDASGGEIWFESEENKGTTFFVKVPLSGMVAHKGSRRLDS